MDLLKLFTETVTEQPETMGFLTELLNSTWTWVTTIGAGAITGVVAIVRSFMPSNSAILSLSDKIAELKEMTNLDSLKIKELETAQKEYQKANDDLLMEIAKNSPNAKIKELGKQLDEKKKELSIQEQIQEKVNSAVKSVEQKAVSILKKKE